jgi:hypothetical protein
VHAPEVGIPIREGETYTVKAYSRDPTRHPLWDEITEAVIEARLGIAAVSLVEVPGLYMATRFEKERDEDET